MRGSDSRAAGEEVTEYEEAYRSSWVHEDLRSSRNFKGGFGRGLVGGLLHGAFVSLTNGREPWTWRHRKRNADSTGLKKNF